MRGFKMCDKRYSKDDIEAVREGLVSGWVISVCKYCKSEYAQQKSRVWRDKYCSRRCGDSFRLDNIKKRTVNCPKCGTEFIARHAQLRGGRIPYCSISCGSKSQERSKERYEKVAESIKKNIKSHKYKRGSDVHNWNGGITVNVHGYIMQRVDGKQVPQHRHMMEVHIGRKLTDDEVVHHINEIKDDNRIENLQIMTRAEHARHHAKQNN